MSIMSCIDNFLNLIGCITDKPVNTSNYAVISCCVRVHEHLTVLTLISICNSSLWLPSRPIKGPKAPVTKPVLSASVYMEKYII